MMHCHFIYFSNEKYIFNELEATTAISDPLNKSQILKLAITHKYHCNIRHTVAVEAYRTCRSRR